MFPVVSHQCTPTLLFLRDNNGNKVTQLFCVICVITLMHEFFTTVFNLNKFILLYVVNIRFICDGEIYFLSTSSIIMMENAFYFILKALLVLKIFKCLSRLFGHAEKQLD